MSGTLPGFTFLCWLDLAFCNFQYLFFIWAYGHHVFRKNTDFLEYFPCAICSLNPCVQHKVCVCYHYLLENFSICCYGRQVVAFIKLSCNLNIKHIFVEFSLILISRVKGYKIYNIKKF